MTRRTIDNVIPELDEWQSKYGDFMYTVKAFFTNKEFVRATKKSRDAAIELQGLLIESAQKPQEFILESDGHSKAGNPKWKLLAFGPLDGPLIYSTLKEGQAPNGGGSVSSGSDNPSEGPTPHRGSSPRASTVQGGTGVAPSSGEASDSRRSTTPSEPFRNNVDASIRASVALKAAASAFGTIENILTAAEHFDAWLAYKSGATPQGSPDQGEGVGQGEGPAPSSTNVNWTERVKTWPNGEPVDQTTS